jgi:hypothetical protein
MKYMRGLNFIKQVPISYAVKKLISDTRSENLQ